MPIPDLVETDLPVTVEAVPVESDGRPKSAIPLGDGLAGLAGLGAVWLAVMLLRPPAIIAAWLVLLATASPMLIRELRRLPAASREHPAFGPIVWLLGFVVATLPFMLVYAQAADVWRWAASWVVVAPAILLRMLVEVRRAGRVSPGFLCTGRGAVAQLRSFPAARCARPPVVAQGVLYSGRSMARASTLSSRPPCGEFRNAFWLVDPAGDLGLHDRPRLCAERLYFRRDGRRARSLDADPRARLDRLPALLPAVFVHWPDFLAVVHQEIGWPQTPLAAPTWSPAPPACWCCWRFTSGRRSSSGCASATSAIAA